MSMSPQSGCKSTENTFHHFRFEDLLYRNVLLEGEETAQSFLTCMRQRPMPADFARASIKALYVGGDVEFKTALEILSMCKGIEILSLIVSSYEYRDNVASLLHMMDTLPIRVLSFQAWVCLTSTLISDVTLFAKVTHLEFDVCRMFEDLDLQDVPQLTHVAMSSSLDTLTEQSPSLIRRLLDHAPLEVLIIRADIHRDLVAFLERHALHDRRIVVAPSKLYNWDSLGRAAMLLWEVAEALVKLPKPNHGTSF